MAEGEGGEMGLLVAVDKVEFEMGVDVSDASDMVILYSGGCVTRRTAWGQNSSICISRLVSGYIGCAEGSPMTVAASPGTKSDDSCAVLGGAVRRARCYSVLTSSLLVETV